MLKILSGAMKNARHFKNTSPEATPQTIFLLSSLFFSSVAAGLPWGVDGGIPLSAYMAGALPPPSPVG